MRRLGIRSAAVHPFLIGVRVVVPGLRPVLLVGNRGYSLHSKLVLGVTRPKRAQRHRDHGHEEYQQNASVEDSLRISGSVNGELSSTLVLHFQVQKRLKRISARRRKKLGHEMPSSFGDVKFKRNRSVRQGSDRRFGFQGQSPLNQRAIAVLGRVLRGHEADFPSQILDYFVLVTSVLIREIRQMFHRKPLGLVQVRCEIIKFGD